MRMMLAAPLKWMALLFVTGLLLGCPVNGIVKFDPPTHDLAVRIERQLGGFYDQLMTAEPEQRSFGAFQADYQALESDLKALVSRNRAREHNAESIAQAENVLSIWRQQRAYFDGKYQVERSMSDTFIRLNRTNMLDEMATIIRTENAKPR